MVYHRDMKTKRFKKVGQGEPFAVPLIRGTAYWFIKCCDCGLEHAVGLKPRKQHIVASVWRNDDLEKIWLPKKHENLANRPEWTGQAQKSKR